MPFSSFQNDTAVLKLRSRNAQGTLTVASSYNIVCDVQFKRREVTTSEGNRITASAEVFVTPTTELNAVSMQNLTRGNWLLTYQSVDYQVEMIDRVRDADSPNINHYKLVLR